MQDDEHVKLYSQPYIEEKAIDDNTYRIYANRSKVNKISVLSGRMAKADDEITIDRLFAENNDIKVGDSIQLNGTSWKVCGLVAFSDYSALFEDNSGSHVRRADLYRSSCDTRRIRRYGGEFKEAG